MRLTRVHTSIFNFDRGWRSWNADHGDVNDTTIRKVVDAVVARKRLVDGKLTSLLDVGFNHVGVDDGWQAYGCLFAFKMRFNTRARV